MEYRSIVLFDKGTKIYYLKFVDNKERLAEIEKLKAESRISEDEYKLLVSLAQKENSAAENSLTAPLATSEDKSSSQSLRTGLIAVGVIVLAVVAFKFLIPGDPIKSNDYKNLVKQKAELISKKTDLEAQLLANPSVQPEIEDYVIKVERWKDVLSQIEGLG